MNLQRSARPSLALLLALCVMLPSLGVAEESFEPFAQSTFHLGGGLEFSWSQASVEDNDADAVTSVGLEGEVGYLLIDNLKVSALPLFTMSSQGDNSSMLMGLAAGVTYYYDLGAAALFGRGQGGFVMGTFESSDSESKSPQAINDARTDSNGLITQESALTIDADMGADGDLTGFVYGAGVGVALPVGTNLVEFAVDYQGTHMTLDSSGQSVDASVAGLYVHLGFLMAF